MIMMKGAIDVITSRRRVTKCLCALGRMNSARSRICCQRPPRAPLPFLPEHLVAEDFEFSARSSWKSMSFGLALVSSFSFANFPRRCLTCRRTVVLFRS